MTHPKKTSQRRGQSEREVTVADIMCVSDHFRRSVQVELDLPDPTSTQEYVPTDFIQACFTRIASAFEPNSTRRAWRLTGDYGSGKSAFVLSLAKAAAGRSSEIPQILQGVVSCSPMLPVIVTGNREPLAQCIGRALVKQVAGLRKSPSPSTTEDLLGLFGQAQAAAMAAGWSGILLVLDELGKNLELSALEPASSDVYVLQRLAELAARSGDQPLVVLAVLHQGIASYTAALDTSTRREWDKVAGRFDEIIFSHPFEQTIQLCAEALSVDTSRLPAPIKEEARKAMQWVVDSGMYGNASSRTMVKLAPRLFPLHPTVLPVLLNLLRRFGQNERSLFGFLSGYEPGGLQEHTGVRLKDADFFRLTDLYSYFRANLAHSINNGKATHWRIIESVVQRASADDAGHLPVLRTVGILNLVDDDLLVASRDLLDNAIAATGQEHIGTSIDSLKSKHILYERGTVRGYCVWPHSSVHLDDAFEDATTALGEPAEPMKMVASLLQPQTIVARKHDIETGNLRHFNVLFRAASEYRQSACNQDKDAGQDEADGHIIILLPENQREYKLVSEQIQRNAQSATNTLIGLMHPPTELLGAAKDLQCWRWVKDNVKELAGDRYARQELRTQLRNAAELLHNQCGRIMGLQQGLNPASIVWFWRGKIMQVSPDGIGASLSGICDKLYPKCPIINNELINRRITSSAASQARTILIEAISSSPDKAFLGMDQSKNPPEIAMYLSVLRAGNVHVNNADEWKIRTPGTRKDTCRIRPALLAIDAVLKKNAGQRVPIPQIIDKLRKEPIGARDGLIPLLLAIYLAANRRQIAAYEDGTYRHSLGGDEFRRLAKEPEFFELQHCAIEGVKLDVFRSLASALGVGDGDTPELLDIVRPLVQFIANVPEYSRNTKHLSEEAVALRQCLLTARDPADLVFQKIPAALKTKPESHKELASRLSQTISEIQRSYDVLLDRLAISITDAFETPDKPRDFRDELNRRCQAVREKLAEGELKSFVLRLGDSDMKYRQWLETLAGNLSQRSPTRWEDADEARYHSKLGILAKRMLRTEAANADITQHPMATSQGRAMRLAITKPDGSELGQILYWSETEETEIKQLTAQITTLIQNNGRTGLSAAVRALWSQLQQE